LEKEHRLRKTEKHTRFGGKPGGNRSLGIPMCGWKDNIKMEFKEKRDRNVWTGFISLRMKP
jgi:hypothetical protein